MSSTEINAQACLRADFPADSEGWPVGSVQLQVRRQSATGGWTRPFSSLIFPKGERGDHGETIQLEDQAMIAGIQVWLLSSEW